MSREVPAIGVNERLVQTSLETLEELAEPPGQLHISGTGAPLEDEVECSTDLLDQAVQLQPRAKIALIRKLVAQLETEQIQTVLEFGLREIGDRHRRGVSSAMTHHNTRLLLKKDYSYQERGLSEPTQYYVYLRRRKPKLDRYIGALFYVPNGCTLSYCLDAEGCIVFNPPHHIFQLRDCNNPAIIQVVRLIRLEPPPPDYTFTKQQNDTPAIQLHLEYLDHQTGHTLSQGVYPFPACMYEGGVLDRYRWEVATLTLSADLQETLTPNKIHYSSSDQLPALDRVVQPDVISSRTSEVNQPIGANQNLLTNSTKVAAPNSRQVLELPTTKLFSFFLVKSSDADLILKRMRLWVTWSEKAMPQSRWELVQDGSAYTLMNARFKRRILSFSRERSAIMFESALPVLMKWFHDLSLAVSQAQNQRQYSTAQLKLAHSLFVDMSLPQKDPIIVLRKLFGAEFVKTDG
jgi:hypothetical protein